jgi:hypothetical protein
VIDQVLHAVSFETEVSVSNSGFDAVLLESMEMIFFMFLNEINLLFCMDQEK